MKPASMISSIPTSADELRVALDQLFPGFSESLIGSHYVWPDGTLTPHGICFELTTYYRERFAAFALSRVKELFELVEAIVAADPKGYFPVSNAIYTCFLEDIASTKTGEASRIFMGPLSRAFFDGWHRPPFK